MIIPGDKRVAQRAAVSGLTTSRYYGAVGGPVGAATMVWGVVFTMLRPGNANLWSGTNLSSGVGGWVAYLSGSALGVAAVSGAGVVTTHQAFPGVFDKDVNFNRPFVLVGSLAGGFISSSLSGGSTPATPTAMAGYTTKPVGQKTTIGTDDSLTNGGTGHTCMVHDTFMLEGYDGTAFASATYGNGLAGINAMWQEDLQQGRYLTWPRAMTTADWYFSARDVVLGGGALKSTWTDRGPNALVLSRTGAPQGSSMPMVF